MKTSNLHNLYELEEQLLSVLGFLLLNYQRSDPEVSPERERYIKSRGVQVLSSIPALHHASPITHVVKVLCELSQVGTLLLILLLRPKQNLWNLEEKKESWLSRR